MANWFCSVFCCVCRKRLSSPRCRSELIDSTWVVIVPGQKCIKKQQQKTRAFHEEWAGPGRATCAFQGGRDERGWLGGPGVPGHACFSRGTRWDWAGRTARAFHEEWDGAGRGGAGRVTSRHACFSRGTRRGGAGHACFSRGTRNEAGRGGAGRAGPGRAWSCRAGPRNATRAFHEERCGAGRARPCVLFAWNGAGRAGPGRAGPAGPRNATRAFHEERGGAGQAMRAFREERGGAGRARPGRAGPGHTCLSRRTRPRGLGHACFSRGPKPAGAGPGHACFSRGGAGRGGAGHAWFSRGARRIRPITICFGEKQGEPHTFLSMLATVLECPCVQSWNVPHCSGTFHTDLSNFKMLS